MFEIWRHGDTSLDSLLASGYLLKMQYEPERRLIGYARVSTEDQDLSLQRAALIKFGVRPEHIYEEHASGKSMKRKALSMALRSMRSEDTIVVWKLDRLGRTLKGVLEVLEFIEKEGVNFVSLTESFDTSTPMGKAFLQFAMVMAELERNLISERTKAGIAQAKTRGVKFGQKHTILENDKRMRKLRDLERRGQLRTPSGKLQMRAQDLMEILNRADPAAKPIEALETVRRWARGEPKRNLKPFEGLDLDADDDPLDIG